ncbi:hypothetical protein MANY_14470 [Mycolicibacterium anyangense]|uniref:Uncharacterized protein n=1 Tax=Mycolicibacterium anyangense TaxID=1431246 RepID=A0A6N4W2J0_9MYCO|nr:hypothetical protein MANY_14470 [Mycolicibacterium anyangense]
MTGGGGSKGAAPTGGGGGAWAAAWVPLPEIPIVRDAPTSAAEASRPTTNWRRVTSGTSPTRHTSHTLSVGAAYREKREPRACVACGSAVRRGHVTG